MSSNIYSFVYYMNCKTPSWTATAATDYSDVSTTAVGSSKVIYSFTYIIRFYIFLILDNLAQEKAEYTDWGKGKKVS